VSKRIIVIADSVEADRDRLAEILKAIGIKSVFGISNAEVLALCDAGAVCAIIDPMVESIDGQELFPELERRDLPCLVVSAGGERDDVLTALRHGCIDWLDKPVESEIVRTALRRLSKRANIELVEDKQQTSAATGRALIKEIAKRIRDCNVDLPEIPDVVKKLNALLTNLEVEAEEVRKVIEQDPSLSARLIATVNTATYGGQYWKGRITDLQSCVTRLGNLAIRNLVQTESIRSLFHFRSPAFKSVFDKMWRAHFMSACLAREVAIAIELENTEEVYLLGLIHNIGELFLLRVLGELFQRQNNQILSMDEVLEMVRDYHCVFGEALSKKWDLGDLFCFVTRNHHDLKAYSDEDEEKQSFIRLMHVVNLADQLVDYAGASYYGKVLPAPGLNDSYTALAVSPEAKEVLRNRAETMYVELFP
jgi:HD-like signal output (HDOD) protein/CheY-like chemotaxis protein